MFISAEHLGAGAALRTWLPCALTLAAGVRRFCFCFVFVVCVSQSTTGFCWLPTTQHNTPHQTHTKKQKKVALGGARFLLAYAGAGAALIAWFVLHARWCCSSSRSGG